MFYLESLKCLTFLVFVVVRAFFISVLLFLLLLSSVIDTVVVVTLSLSLSF